MNNLEPRYANFLKFKSKESSPYEEGTWAELEGPIYAIDKSGVVTSGIGFFIGWTANDSKPSRFMDGNVCSLEDFQVYIDVPERGDVLIEKQTIEEIKNLVDNIRNEKKDRRVVQKL